MTKLKHFDTILSCIVLVACHRDATLELSKKGEDPSPLIAAFSFSPNICSTPNVIDFSNSSQNAKSYQWDFGDGTSSTVSNPSKTYQNAGDYMVKLTVYSSKMSTDVTKTITILTHSTGVSPEARFETAMDLASNLVVTFTNKSTYANSYLWDFGDGSPLSQTACSNFVHTYPGPGRYLTRLIASNKQGGNCYTVTIDIMK